MRPLKVLTFGWEFAPVVTGGLGIVSRDLSNALAQQGVQVTFVLPKIQQKFQTADIELIDADIDEYVENISYKKIDSLIGPYMNPSSYYEKRTTWSKRENTQEIYGPNLFAEVERFAARASQIAATTNFDIIHAHDWMTYSAAHNASIRSGKPFVAHIHATEFDRGAGNPNQYIAKLEGDGLNKAHHIIAVSEKTKRTLIDNYGLDPAKISVVHNAVGEASETSPIGKTYTKSVLFLGRMALMKGIDYLLYAAKKVVARDKDVKFIFVGKGEMMEDLINLTIDLDISDNVIFAGFLSHSEVDKAYKSARLFVMPSISEPFGLTALEAIRNGTPVLMSRQSGVSEVVKNCLKVDFWDIDDMASKILAVIGDKTLASSLSSNGFNDLLKLSWRQQAEKVKNIFEMVING